MLTTGQRVGKKHVANAVGFQVSASIIGWAVLPGLAGLIATRATLDAIPYFVVCAAFLVFVTHEVASRARRGSMNM
jgi:fucose permease